MAYSEVNNIAGCSISDVNGVAKDSINSINGITPGTCAAATRWVAGTNEQYAGYAAHSDLTSWTFYDRVDDGHPCSYDVAYGKDASGNGIYVMSQSSSTKEVSVSSTDVTDGNAWTHKNFSGSGDFYMNVAWSNDVWITAGMDGDAFRSTDGGSSWSKIDLSGVTGYDSNENIEALAADGAGKWLMGQEDDLFYSDDDGASWSRVHSFTNTYAVKGIAYTNNSWVVAYVRTTDSTKTYIRSAASSDLTTWSSEAGGGTLQNPDVMGNTGGFERISIAADASGRIVILPFNRQKIGYADIDGTNTPANFNVVDLSSTVPSNEDLKDVATDGSTWIACGQDGVLLKSTNSGVSWSLEAQDIYDANHDIMCITADVYLPLT
tara:strand:+ start:1410 stop:2543 length:1134 start_codon:yes stop_codon:yes gene_type:complete